MASVQVIPRFRPFNKRELSEAGGSEMVLTFEPDDKAFTIVDPQSKEKKPLRFTFDHVLRPDVSQEEAYKWTAQPLLKDVFDGYNTTIFTYGQTGSGKTYTMMGDMNSEEQKGIIPRLVDGIFQCIEASASTVEFTVKVSYVEIYNEKIRDLLEISKDNLKIRESPMGVWLEDVSQTYVRDANEVFNVMKEGGKNRAISATKMNAESSRSHSVFILTLGQKDSATGTVKGAKLTLIDLAGSEKVGKTGAEGQTLKEAQNINKSLSALGNVINALTSQPTSKDPKAKKPHIPYRDSKLTYLLSDSLGGNSKTCLIVTGSPSRFNVEETLSTIRFGTRAKSIKNKPKVNQERSVAEYQRLLAHADTRIATLEAGHVRMEAELNALRTALCRVSPDYLSVATCLSVGMRSNVGKKSKVVSGDEGWLQYIRDDGDSGITIEDILSQQQHDHDDHGDEESKGDSETPEHDMSVLSPFADADADESVTSPDGGVPASDSNPTSTSTSDLSSDAIMELTRVKQEAEERVCTLEERISILQSSLDQAEADRLAWAEREQELKEASQQSLLLETQRHQVEVQEMSVLYENTQREKQQSEQHVQQFKRDLKATEKEAAELKRQLQDVLDRANETRDQVTDFKKKQDQDGELLSQEREKSQSQIHALEITKKQNMQLQKQHASIMSTLENKCGELVDAQLCIAACKAHIATLEQTLLQTQSSLATLEATSQTHTASLRDKLTVTEEMCRKLLESGKYWKSQGRYGGHGGRVVVPVQGKQINNGPPVVTRNNTMSAFF